MLQLNNIYKYFGEHLVLNDINLSISENSIVGLAGPSGSGKSTLLRCIQGLDKPDSGEIICNAATGFMFQDFQLFPHMTVIKNLVYAPSVTKKTDYEKDALQLLVKLGIAEHAQKYPAQLSGGQKQRVALARALMMQPKLLLCDEPTSGLDVATIEDVVSLLLSVRSMQMSIVIASHDLDFLTCIADRIVVLKNGLIVADLNPQDKSAAIEELKKYY